MGIRTVAERVDSARVLAALAEIGVQYAQGRYIGAPEPIAELESRIARPERELRLQA
jgi:EAL domain-containing protein (putative c-di-GMP-specific phosphodiesterase class I)